MGVGWRKMGTVLLMFLQRGMCWPLLVRDTFWICPSCGKSSQQVGLRFELDCIFRSRIGDPLPASNFEFFFYPSMYACIYMPYPTPERYLYHRLIPSPSKSAHEQATARQCTACPVQNLHLQLHVCICSMHGDLPYLASCSHDLHISCFPEGIMTDGHLGAPPSGPYSTNCCRQEKRLFFLANRSVICSMKW